MKVAVIKHINTIVEEVMTYEIPPALEGEFERLENKDEAEAWLEDNCDAIFYDEEHIKRGAPVISEIKTINPEALGLQAGLINKEKFY